MKDFAIWLEENGWHHWIDDKYNNYHNEGWEHISILLAQYLNEKFV